MSYSINMLTTPAECDAAQALVDDTLKVLRHQEEIGDYQRDNTTESASESQTEMASLDAEIASLNNLIPTLVAGATRKKRERELRKAISRRADLVDMQEQRGPVALLKREMKLALIRLQIAELILLTAGITARRAAL